jgi:hypothetical protein
MSTTDLYVLNKASVRHLAEFRNGWGSAPIVWDFLAEKYLGGRVNPFSGDGYRPVWDLASDDRLTAAEKVVLMMTFDRMFVPIDHLDAAADACGEFYTQSAAWSNNMVNHWGAIGEALRSAKSLRRSRHARGVCMSCTSVSDPWIDAQADTFGKAWSIFKDDDRAIASAESSS